MRLTIATTLCVLMGAAQAAASAPQDDDWEFAEDPARQLTVAAARYDNGPSIIMQCREGALAVLLVGMPAGADAIELAATRADGRADVQVWRPVGSEGVFRSSVPARDARFLRGGGAYAVRTEQGAAPAFGATFDLPSESANLDRVLTACGWDLTDERDQLPRATDLSLTNPDESPARNSRSRSRSITERRRQTPPPAPAQAPDTPAEQLVSCVVRDLRLTDCRPMHAPVAGAPDPDDVLRWLTGRQVYGAEASTVEGRVFYNDRPEPLIVVERIELR